VPAQQNHFGTSVPVPLTDFTVLRQCELEGVDEIYGDARMTELREVDFELGLSDQSH
jgi:hypothetical protein